MDHDQRLKAPWEESLDDFLWLFFPQKAELLEFTQTE